MNPNDLATRYRLLNSSFKKTMIYHIGIDPVSSPNIPICFTQCFIAYNTKYSSSSTPTTPTSDGKKVGKIVSPPSASKCMNRFITPITPIASPPGRH